MASSSPPDPLRTTEALSVGRIIAWGGALIATLVLPTFTCPLVREYRLTSFFNRAQRGLLQSELLSPLSQSHFANSICSGNTGSLVVCPHSQNFDSLHRIQHLINQPMLNVDSTGIGARQITQQLLVGRRTLIRILGNNIQKLLRFRLQMGRCQFLGIFVGLLGVDQRPDHLTRPASWNTSAPASSFP